MKQTTGYLTNRVDFSYNEKDYTAEQAFEEIVYNNFKGTNNVYVIHKESTTTIVNTD